MFFSHPTLCRRARVLRGGRGQGRGGPGGGGGARGLLGGGADGGAARRGAAGLHLRLELSHLLGAGQVLQQVVLLLQLRVALNQLLDLLLQHLHLLAHGVHQVTLHQVLQRGGQGRHKQFNIFNFAVVSFSQYDHRKYEAGVLGTVRGRSEQSESSDGWWWGGEGRGAELKPGISGNTIC